MVKAVFHRHQRVYVEPAGTWAQIEKVNPVWVPGFAEPVRVTYDCGLGRDFAAEELQAGVESETRDKSHQVWRLMRARNKWQAQDSSTHHPMPGTYPVVVTDSNGWGGWRVPAAEYDRDPELIEMQARLIAAAPGLQTLAKALVNLVQTEGDMVPDGILELAGQAMRLTTAIESSPAICSRAVRAPLPDSPPRA